MTIVTRFPPSPTGYLHIGGARTALFNWLYAKKLGGEMVLRIEDTDRERSTTEAVEVIMKAMEWLGLTWNRGPFFQTERFDRYEEVIQQLLKEGHAYYCFCSRERLDAVREQQRKDKQKPRYDRCCRDLNRVPEDGEEAVIRFPQGELEQCSEAIAGLMTSAASLDVELEVDAGSGLNWHEAH